MYIHLLGVLVNGSSERVKECKTCFEVDMPKPGFKVFSSTGFPYGKARVTFSALNPSRSRYLTVYCLFWGEK